MEATDRSTSPVPKGFHNVTPYLVVDGAAELIEFLQRAFDAKQTFRMDDDNGRITHATVTIGDSALMISDTMDGMSPQNAMLYLYLDHVDDVFARAVNANAAVAQELKDQFYGDRTGAVKDRWGNTWWIATHVEEVDPAELKARAKVEYERRKGQPHSVH